MNDTEVKLDMCQESIKEIQKDLAKIPRDIKTPEAREFSLLIGMAIGELHKVLIMLDQAEKIIPNL